MNITEFKKIVYVYFLFCSPRKVGLLPETNRLFCYFFFFTWELNGKRACARSLACFALPWYLNCGLSMCIMYRSSFSLNAVFRNELCECMTATADRHATISVVFFSLYFLGFDPIFKSFTWTGTRAPLTRDAFVIIIFFFCFNSITYINSKRLMWFFA